jgi:hypothetical protein
MKTILLLVLSCALLACSSAPSDTDASYPTARDKSPVQIIAPTYIFWTQTYSKQTTQGAYTGITWQDQNGATHPASTFNPDQYFCQWLGGSTQYEGAEMQRLDVLTNGNWATYVFTQGATGTRTMQVVCVLTSYLEYLGLGSSYRVDQTFGLSASPGHTQQELIWAAGGSGGPEWCTLRGVQGPMNSAADSSSVTLSGTNWYLTTSDAATNPAARTSWAGCVFGLWPTTADSFSVNASIHAAGPAHCDPIFGASLFSGPMPQVTSSAQMLQPPQTGGYGTGGYFELINADNGGWPTMSMSSIYVSCF